MAAAPGFAPYWGRRRSSTTPAASPSRLAIALTGDHRCSTLPDVPTFRESGLKDADVESIWGLHAPAGTPIELRHAMRTAVAEVLRDPETVPKLTERGYEVIANTPEEHQKQTEALVGQWIEVGKKANLKE